MESDLQPQNLARAMGGGSTPSGPSDSGSLYSIVTTPRRNNSVYPVWGRDYDPRDRRDGEVVGWPVRVGMAAIYLSGARVGGCMRPPDKLALTGSG